MLKLVKYEYRKALTPLMVIVCGILALEAYFLGSMAAKSDAHVIISTTILVIGVFAAAITVFVLGVSAYSREMRQRCSYLVFMTPNSTLSVVSAKLLFTLLTGVLLTAVMALLIWLDFPMLMNYFGEWESYYEMLNALMVRAGVDLGGVWRLAAFYLLLMYAEAMATVSVSYVSVTLSLTLLHNSKGSGILSFAFFAAITYGLSKITGLYVNEDALIAYDWADLNRILVPAMAQQLLVILASTFSCAWMLKRGVSL